MSTPVRSLTPVRERAKDMLATPRRESRHNLCAPSVVDENMLNVSRRRAPAAKQKPPSPWSSQNRVLSHPRARNVRQAVSTPAMRAPSARLRLKPRGSRLDLLDNQNLTSFPSLSFTGNSALHIIDDYFPARPVSSNEPIDTESNSWPLLLQKKLRWRWRLGGLIH